MEYSLIFWLRWDTEASQMLSIIQLSTALGLYTDCLPMPEMMLAVITALYPSAEPSMSLTRTKSNVFKLSASTQESDGDSAEEKSSTANPAAVKVALATQVPSDFKWLLVFDNAPSPESLGDFLQASPMGDLIVVTSDIKKWDRSPTPERPFAPIEVAKYSREDSIRFLQEAHEVCHHHSLFCRGFFSSNAVNSFVYTLYYTTCLQRKPHLPGQLQIKHLIGMAVESMDLPVALAFADRYMTINVGMTIFEYQTMV